MGGELRPVTSLRFLAASYVFLFHIQIRWPLAEQTSAFGRLLGNGAVGMTLFFVLSGFVLAYRFAGGPLDIDRYALGRLFRIYPVYLLAATSTIPWLISSIQNGSSAGTVGQYVFVVLSNVFLIQAWFPQLFAYWNDGASWSISTECFFIWYFH